MSESSKPLWFLDTLTYIRVSAEDSADGLSAIEFLAPHGSSPPLHVHLEEDELFHVIDGTLRVSVEGKDAVLQAGHTALGPRGKPHSFRVESETARFVIVTRNRLFERFVRAMSLPAASETLPRMDGPPTPEQIAALMQVAREHKIEFVGPPLS